MRYVGFFSLVLKNFLVVFNTDKQNTYRDFMPFHFMLKELLAELIWNSSSSWQTPILHLSVSSSCIERLSWKLIVCIFVSPFSERKKLDKNIYLKLYMPILGEIIASLLVIFIFQLQVCCLHETWLCFYKFWPQGVVDVPLTLRCKD